MRITLNIPTVPKNKEDHWRGILVSLFGAIEDILAKKRRGSYLIHFFQERLDRTEKREFRRIIAKIIPQLSKRREGNVAMTASSKGQRIPKEYEDILNFFRTRGVSIHANVSHQASKADTTPKELEVSTLVEEAILGTCQNAD